MSVPSYQVLLVNGPPRSGKNELARQLSYRSTRIVEVSSSGRLKRATVAFYRALQGFELDDNSIAADLDWIEAAKDLNDSAGLFLGARGRDVLISISERHTKHVHGPEVFGVLTAQQILAGLLLARDAIVVVTGVGFTAEARPIVTAVGPERVLVVEIERPGCSFEGDSRGRLDVDELGVDRFIVSNNGDLGDLGTSATRILTCCS